MSTRDRMLAQFERTSYAAGPYAASIVGVVIGPLVALSVVTTIIVALGRWHHWIGLALSLFVVIGALAASLDLYGSITLRREPEQPYSRLALNGLVFARAIEVVMFVVALAVLYVCVFRSR